MRLLFISVYCPIRYMQFLTVMLNTLSDQCTESKTNHVTIKKSFQFLRTVNQDMLSCDSSSIHMVAANCRDKLFLGVLLTHTRKLILCSVLKIWCNTGSELQKFGNQNSMSGPCSFAHLAHRTCGILCILFAIATLRNSIHSFSYWPPRNIVHTFC